MSLSEQQIAMLSAHLDRAHVKSRTQAGRALSYLESWHCISEANRIFNFDGWHSEVVELRQVAERDRGDGKFGVSYVCKVRVTVLAGGRVIIRDGIGAGHGIDRDLGNAHESAAKEAEADARKRSLMTFGNPFGLALYDKSMANVSDGTDAPQPLQSAPAPAPRLPAPPQPPARSEGSLAAARNASEQLRDAMLAALGHVYTPDHIEAFKTNYPREAWARMSNVDRAAVTTAYRNRERVVALDAQRPLQ